MIPTIRVDKDIQSVAKSLEKKVGLAPLFYQNAPVVLDFEGTEGSLGADQIVNLFEEIHRLSLIPVGITFSSDSVVQDIAKQYRIPFINSLRQTGTATKVPASQNPTVRYGNRETTDGNAKLSNATPAHTPPRSPIPTLSPSFPLPSTTSTTVPNDLLNEDGPPPLIIKSSLRSGQQIYARNGADLIIMGSVHSGAEALADGNIHVYGSLKGRALAGVSGNNEAKIFSGRFQAELISIADTYCACEEQPAGTDPNKPSVVWLENGNLKFSAIE